MPQSRMVKKEEARQPNHRLASDHVFLDGIRHFHDADYDGAVRRFTSALATNPNDPIIIASLAHANLHAGDTGRAQELYNQLVTKKQSDPAVLFNLALLELKSGNFKDAEQHLASIDEKDVDLVAGRFYLGILFSSNNDFLSDVALYRARILKNLGKLDLAEEQALKSYDKRPKSVATLLMLGEITLRQKHYIRSIQWLEKALEFVSLEEDRINIHNNLGIAHYENGAIDDAINHLTIVLREAPDNPFAVHNLNYIYEREGILRQGLERSRSMRFLDMEDAASPTFELSAGDSDDYEKGEVIIGKSSVMLRAMRHARVAATNDSPVLITGASGTGKELLARAITKNSKRNGLPFIVINCQSVTEIALESELFGHEKGAFTGARTHKDGAFEQAGEGTVFLDDITSLTPMLQGRLYRALRDRLYVPQGGHQSVPIKARIIVAATHDLRQYVAEGKFREDLFYELNVIGISLPPLCERREDIPLLVDYFLRRHSVALNRHFEMRDEDLKVLLDYDWPGNVRELENTIQKAVVLGSQSNLYLEELKRARKRREDDKASKHAPKPVEDPEDFPSLDELEKEHIIRVLASVDNNQRRAARILGINPSTLWRKLKHYGLDH